jgi:glycosyltransferase involved in cell wall biosynthesis
MTDAAVGKKSANELDLSIVLPAYNEVSLLSSTVSNLISGLREGDASFEVIIVENGSSDETLKLAHLLADELPSVLVLTQPVGNYGAALVEGICAARGRRIATFDVDYYDLGFLAQALARMDATGAGIVVASKRAPGASDQRPLPRRLVTLAFTMILKNAVGLKVSDAHGMKLLDREAVLPLVAKTVLRDSLFDVELIIRAQQSGILVEELPASVRELRPARSPVLKRALRAGVDIVRLRRLLAESRP